jgi:hypothetical protein
MEKTELELSNIVSSLSGGKKDKEQGITKITNGERRVCDIFMNFGLWA